MKTIWESSWGAKLMGIGRTLLIATYLISFGTAVQPVSAQSESVANTSTPAIEVVSSSITSGQIVSATNQMRVEVGDSAVAISSKLARSAQLKAEDMANKSYFAHENSLGQRLAYWLGVVGYPYRFAGENLAVGFSTAEATMQGWRNSPGHYANIVKLEYKEIGVGVASGMYQGRPVVFVVQHFGATKDLVIPIATDLELMVQPVFVSQPTVNSYQSTVTSQQSPVQKPGIQVEAVADRLPVSLTLDIFPVAQAGTTDILPNSSDASKNVAVGRLVMLGMVALIWLSIGAVLYVEMSEGKLSLGDKPKQISA